MPDVIGALFALTLIGVGIAIGFLLRRAVTRRAQVSLARTLADLYALKANHVTLQNQAGFLTNALRMRDARDFAEGPILDSPPAIARPH
jgi:hypothetical protein